jgi:hypothetical protein
MPALSLQCYLTSCFYPLIRRNASVSPQVEVAHHGIYILYLAYRMIASGRGPTPFEMEVPQALMCMQETASSCIELNRAHHIDKVHINTAHLVSTSPQRQEILIRASISTLMDYLK